MEKNKFFRFVWRFNGLILMIAGLLSILVLVFGGYKVFRDTTRENNTWDIVNVQEENEVKKNWHLGYMSIIRGSPYVMVPLNSNQIYAQSYYSKTSSSVRNYIFSNMKSNEKNWLFDDNQYLIADIDFLPEKQNGSDDRDVRAILYKIVKRDTDNDKRLTTDDLQTVGLSLPSGKNYREILDEIDLIIGHTVVDKNTLLIVFQRKGIGFSANVDLSTFTVSNETELHKVSS